MTIDIESLRAEVDAALAAVWQKYGLTPADTAPNHQMSTKKCPILKSEASQRIYGLRKALNLSQETFAGKLGVRRSAAVHWESGRTKPSVETYIAMASLATADVPGAIWFLEQAVINIELFGDLFRKIDQHSIQIEHPA